MGMKTSLGQWEVREGPLGDFWERLYVRIKIVGEKRKMSLFFSRHCCVWLGFLELQQPSCGHKGKAFFFFFLCTKYGRMKRWKILVFNYIVELLNQQSQGLPNTRLAMREWQKPHCNLPTFEASITCSGKDPSVSSHQSNKTCKLNMRQTDESQWRGQDWWLFSTHWYLHLSCLCPITTLIG